MRHVLYIFSFFIIVTIKAFTTVKNERDSENSMAMREEGKATTPETSDDFFTEHKNTWHLCHYVM